MPQVFVARCSQPVIGPRDGPRLIRGRVKIDDVEGHRIQTIGRDDIARGGIPHIRAVH